MMFVSSMTDGDGAAGGRDGATGGMEGAGEETEVDITGGWLTEELERAGGWMGGLEAGSVGDKKTVEMTVTVTGSPAAGSVAWGVPLDVKEGIPPPPVKPVGTSVSSVGRVEGLTVGMAGEVADGVEEEQSDGMEDGSTVTDGSTAVDVPGVPLERVAPGSSNEASLRTRLGYPSSTISRAHQDPTPTCQPTYPISLELDRKRTVAWVPGA